MGMSNAVTMPLPFSPARRSVSDASVSSSTYAESVIAAETGVHAPSMVERSMSTGTDRCTGQRLTMASVITCRR
jgi:hypothetical protein